MVRLRAWPTTAVARVGDFFCNFTDITSGLSHHLEQKFSKNTLPCPVQPFLFRKWVWPTTPVARVGQFFLILYTSPVVSATTSNKKFQKIRYRAPYSVLHTDRQTDRRTDGRTHEHSEIINVDILRNWNTIIKHYDYTRTRGTKHHPSLTRVQITRAWWVW